MRHRTIFAIPLAILLCLTVGCVSSEVDGRTTTYTYEIWAPLTVLVGGVTALPFGVLLLKRIKRLGIVVLISGLIAAVMVAPSMFRDQVIVSDEDLHLRTGFWGLTAVHHVQFADVESVTFEREVKRGRRGRKRVSEFLLFQTRQGVARVPVSNRLTRAAMEDIIARLGKRGIAVRK